MDILIGLVTFIMILFLIIVIALFCYDATIDVTKDNDVVLWYNHVDHKNHTYKRHFIKLFKLKS